MNSRIEHTQLNSDFGSSQNSFAKEFPDVSRLTSDSDSQFVQHNASQSSINSVARTPFSCRFESTKYLVNVLSCLSEGTRKVQHCQCEALDNGIVIFLM